MPREAALGHLDPRRVASVVALPVGLRRPPLALPRAARTARSPRTAAACRSRGSRASRRRGCSSPPWRWPGAGSGGVPAHPPWRVRRGRRRQRRRENEQDALHGSLITPLARQVPIHRNPAVALRSRHARPRALRHPRQHRRARGRARGRAGRPTSSSSAATPSRARSARGTLDLPRHAPHPLGPRQRRARGRRGDRRPGARRGRLAAITAKLTADEIGAERARPLGDLPLTARSTASCTATPRRATTRRSSPASRPTSATPRRSQASTHRSSSPATPTSSTTVTSAAPASSTPAASACPTRATAPPAGCGSPTASRSSADRLRRRARRRAHEARLARRPLDRRRARRPGAGDRDHGVLRAARSTSDLGAISRRRPRSRPRSRSSPGRGRAARRPSRGARRTAGGSSAGLARDQRLLHPRGRRAPERQPAVAVVVVEVHHERLLARARTMSATRGRAARSPPAARGRARARAPARSRPAVCQ